MPGRHCIAALSLLLACGPQTASTEPDPEGSSGAGEATDAPTIPTTTGEPTTLEPTTLEPTTDAPDPTGDTMGTGPVPDACDEIVLDPNLRATVLFTLGLPDDTVLTPELALAPTILHSTNSFGDPVQSLAGLECFPNLADLTIDASTVSDLAPLAGLPLTRLSLRSSAVTDLSPLAGSPTLAVLIVTEAPLADLAPVASMLALKALVINDAPLVDLSPLAGHPTLSDLDASVTHVQDLTPLVTLPALARLYLNHCDLTSLAGLTGAPALVELALNDNNLTSLDGLESLGDLQLLELSNNQIAELAPIGALAQLVALKLTDNLIADLGPLAGTTALTSLEIGNNPLVGLAGIEALPLTFVSAEHTGLTELVAVAPNTLDFLYLTGNAITDLTPLAGHQVLHTLNIVNNAVTTVAPITQAPWITTGCPVLRLSGNPLDANTIETLIPALCADDHSEVTWDQGMCAPMNMQCQG